MQNRPISSYSADYGPVNPFSQNNPFGGKIGIEPTNVDSYVFKQQYSNFQKHGFAEDTSSNAILGNVAAAAALASSTSTEDRPKKKAKGSSKVEDYLKYLDDDDDDNAGPWGNISAFVSAPSIAALKDTESGGKVGGSSNNNSSGGGAKTSGDIKKNSEYETLESALASSRKNVIPSSEDYPVMNIIEPDEEAEKWEKFNERKIQFGLPQRPKRGSVPNEATSAFHGQSLKDYQGRPWCHIPSDMKAESNDESHACFIPRKCVKKLTGHSKGVHSVEFYPGVGHLLLSASYDGTCKIWDALEDKGMLRTYSGHSEGVRSINIHSDGRSFLSSAFDRYIRLWDIETGVAKQTFTNRQMNYCVKFAPKDPNVFLAAASDNKIYQWDCRAGQIVLEYNNHLQAVNTVLFFDDGNKFMSTSDDKKILVWEYDTPIPIQQIAEPEMFSLPAVALHPSGGSLVGQSLDNSIVTYSCERSLKAQHKRVFRGHNNSGYACQMTFSPNGKFLASGDGFGKLYFWDWKSGKLSNKFQAHDTGACISTAWHPLRPSVLASCGMEDKTIKIWE